HGEGRVRARLRGERVIDTDRSAQCADIPVSESAVVKVAVEDDQRQAVEVYRGDGKISRSIRQGPGMCRTCIRTEGVTGGSCVIGFLHTPCSVSGRAVSLS